MPALPIVLFMELVSRITGKRLLVYNTHNDVYLG